MGLFILGFAAVFTLYGAAFGLVGWWMLRWQDLLMRILGIVVVLMGLVLLGSFSWLQQTRKMSLTRRTGRGALLAFVYCLGLGIPVVLVALGLGWVTRVLGLVRRHLHHPRLTGHHQKGFRMNNTPTRRRPERTGSCPRID